MHDNHATEAGPAGGSWPDPLRLPGLLKRASLLQFYCARLVLQAAACLAGLKASIDSCL